MSRGEYWPEGDIELLRHFWHDGTPTNEIARRLHRSKNSIVGKAHRLKLPGRPSPIIRSTLESRRRPRPVRGKETLSILAATPAANPPPAALRATPAPVIKAAPPPPPPARVRPLSADGCQWPIGEPGTKEFRFCGNPAAHPYCAAHAAIAFAKPRERPSWAR